MTLTLQRLLEVQFQIAEDNKKDSQKSFRLNYMILVVTAVGVIISLAMLIMA